MRLDVDVGLESTGSTSCDSGYCGGHVLTSCGHSGYCGGHVLMRLDVDVGLE